MRYLLTALLCAFIALSFTGRKCDHVFVEVEQANVRVEQPDFSPHIVYPELSYSWPTWLQEGKELICVKCFHMQRQILDYGKPETGPTLGALILSQGSPINACPFYDSILTSNKGGWLKVDTSFIIHSK